MSLKIYRPDTAGNAAIPEIGSVQAGFPSPAQDYIEDSINIHDIVVKHSSTTFFARVSGDSLYDADIRDGDIAVVDKSLKPVNGDLAVCCIDGEFTLKYIEFREDGLWLLPANEKYQPIHVPEDDQFTIWGIVTYTIKSHRGRREK